MIILDTNVLSELMKVDGADRRVLTWFRSLRTQPVTTIVNRAELIAGIAQVPPGRRRDRLRTGAEQQLDLIDKLLPLTVGATAHYGDILVERALAGRPVGTMDALIAAIARDAGLPIATRNLRDFEGLGIELVNPWEEAVD